MEKSVYIYVKCFLSHLNLMLWEKNPNPRAEHPSTGWKLSIETLIEEIKSLVSEEVEFEN